MKMGVGGGKGTRLTMLAFLLDLLILLLIVLVITRILSYLFEEIIRQRGQFKREVVKLAAQPGGVTPTKLALEQNISVKQATKILNKLVKEGYLDTTVDEKGILSYKLLDTTIRLE
jgi:predicted transcriptional regulator